MVNKIECKDQGKSGNWPKNFFFAVPDRGERSDKNERLFDYWYHAAAVGAGCSAWLTSHKMSVCTPEKQLAINR